MDHEQRQALYADQVRAKYNASQLKALGAKGHAFKNANGDWSYPVDDAEDLSNAIQAVGRGGADHDAIRKYVIGRAEALGLSSKVPDNWNADGSLKSEQSDTPDGEHRDDPGPEDWNVGYGLKQAKLSIASVKASQLSDPDLKSDPDDAAVMAAIEKAEAAIDKAIIAQSKDGRPDREAKSTVPAVPKRAFPSLMERPLPVSRVELRDGGDDTVANFHGYPSTTGNAYSVRDWLGEYDETIQPGAFAKTLREQSDVPLLFNHDGYPLASTGSGTSRLSEDAHGLLNEATLDRADGATNTVCVQLKRGVLNKMSFSFRAVKDTWNDDYDQRAVNELALYDTSIVTYPANPATTAELRSLFCDSIGREGQGVMWSLRAAFADDLEQRSLPEEADSIVEQAIRALAYGDEIICRRAVGPHVRARTFVVAGLMEQVRKGAKLSKANHQLLQSAVDALSGAAKTHAKTVAAHDKAAGAVQSVLDSNGPSNSAGLDGDAGGGTSGGPGSKNPILPSDGAGPRSLPPAVIKAKRELDRLRLPRKG